MVNAGVMKRNRFNASVWRSGKGYDARNRKYFASTLHIIMYPGSATIGYARCGHDGAVRRLHFPTSLILACELGLNVVTV